MKYTEQEVIINDEVIDSGGPMEVIDPVWWSVDHENEETYKTGLSKWSKEQGYIYAIEWYNSEVNNGGHYQFFDNSAGIVWEDAVEGLKALGLDDYAENLRMASLSKDGYLSKDRETRQKQLEENDDSLENFDDVFFSLDEKNPLFDAEMSYIKSNRNKFYFKGTVVRPDTSQWDNIMLETLKKYPPTSQA